MTCVRAGREVLCGLNTIPLGEFEVWYCPLLWKETYKGTYDVAVKE